MLTNILKPPKASLGWCRGLHNGRAPSQSRWKEGFFHADRWLEWAIAGATQSHTKFYANDATIASELVAKMKKAKLGVLTSQVFFCT